MNASRITRTAAVALIALITTACGASTGTATPIGTPGGSNAAQAPASTEAAPATGHLGQGYELKTGQSDITVTLVKWLPTAAAKDPSMDTPSAGDRYAAAEFRIVNDSSATFSDSPTNGVKAIGSDGQQYDPGMMVSGLTVGTTLDGGVNLVAHGSALGWIVFEVPKAAKITGVQYTSDSGFGATAQWTLG